jgi:hypothetical protein
MTGWPKENNGNFMTVSDPAENRDGGLMMKTSLSPVTHNSNRTKPTPVPETDVHAPSRPIHGMSLERISFKIHSKIT